MDVNPANVMLHYGLTIQTVLADMGLAADISTPNSEFGDDEAYRTAMEALKGEASAYEYHHVFKGRSIAGSCLMVGCSLGLVSAFLEGRSRLGSTAASLWRWVLMCPI